MQRTTSLLISSIAMALSASAFAQSSNNSCDGAVLRDVVGNVLVSTNDGMRAGIDMQNVGNKTRVTTTGRSSVTISFNCGCDVKLKENERIDVESPNTCGALLAAVTAVPVGAAIGATAATAGGLGTTTGLLVAGGVGVGAILLYRNSQNSSPN